MRETRNAQASIFEFFLKHEHGVQLKALSELLDEHPDILDIVARDLCPERRSNTGAQGLSVENVLRCLILKQVLQVSYSRLSFHLADSATYRSFARLAPQRYPSRSALQSTIRQVSAESMELINQSLMSEWLSDGSVDFNTLRIDSTVVESNIAPPSDSSLLEDGIRVLSRLLAKSKECAGIKLRTVDQRKRARSLAFQIFHAKKAEKDALYPELIQSANTTIKQADRALSQIDPHHLTHPKTAKWYEQNSLQGSVAVRH